MSAADFDVAGADGAGDDVPGTAVDVAADVAADAAADVDVVVVGGGVAGLVAALGAAESGLRTLVLEADTEPGGCVRLHTVAGLTLDRGADSFATARPAVADLIARLGLPVQRPAAVGAWVRHESGSAPLPAGALLGIPANPSAADVRRVIGTAGSWRARVDRLAPPRYAIGGDLGRMVRRRMGQRVLHRLVDPVVGGVYSTDAAAVDVDAVAPGLRAAVAEAGSLAAAVRRIRGAAPPAGSAVAGLIGGMGTLVPALVAALTARGGTLRCATEVRRVQRVGGRWAVTTSAPHLPVVRAPAVVLALPAVAARPLLAAATEDSIELPSATPSPVLLATLVVDAPALDAAPRGTGVLVAPRVRSVAAKAITHATAKWRHLADQVGPGRHVLRLSYGRGGATPPDSQFPDLALADAADLLGVPLGSANLTDYTLVRFPDQLATRRPGQSAEIDALRERLARWPGLHITGSAVAGTGLAAVVTDATTIPQALRAGGEGRMGL